MNTPTQRAHNLQIISDQKDEIERLKEENQALLFTYNQLEREWYAQQKLITELADALESKQDDFTFEEYVSYMPLMKRSRDAIK